MKYFFLLSAFVILISACGIDPKEITVIDNVRLGMTEEEFYEQLDSLKIEKKVAYTNLFLNDVDEINENKISMYTTKIFDLSDYSESSENIHHIGIYFPAILSGTKNIIALNVLLAHTGNVRLIYNNRLSIIKDIPGISQDVPVTLINDIEQMLNSKYGKPTSTYSFSFTNFYVINGTEIKPYRSDTSNVGEMITWENKNLRIQFYKGIKAKQSSFNSNSKYYTHYFDPIVSLTTNEIECRSYSYISYSLTDKAIKEIGLDKLQI
jgi:hypothetical protein